MSFVTGKPGTPDPLIGSGSSSCCDGGRVAGEQLIAVAEVVIQAEAALIVIVGQQSEWRSKATGRYCGSGIRDFRFERDRAQQKRRNHADYAVVAERLAGELVDQRHGMPVCVIRQTGEIAACARAAVGTMAVRVSPCAIALAFVVSEEEIFVVPDGAAERGAELILVQRLSGCGEEVARIEGVIAEEVVEVAVKLVRAGFA